MFVRQKLTNSERMDYGCYSELTQVITDSLAREFYMCACVCMREYYMSACTFVC